VFSFFVRDTSPPVARQAALSVTHSVHRVLQIVPLEM